MLRRSLFLQHIQFSFLAVTATAQADHPAAVAAREAEDRRRSEAEIAAYRKALQENTRERAPLEWAATQLNFGETLSCLSGGDSILGKGESATAELEEAVAAFHQALQERTRARAAWLGRDPESLGGALEWLGSRESGTARFTEAVAAFGEALKERTRERGPYDWARTRRISAMRSQSSASERPGRRGSSKPFPLIARC